METVSSTSETTVALISGYCTVAELTHGMGLMVSQPLEATMVKDVPNIMQIPSTEMPEEISLDATPN